MAFSGGGDSTALLHAACVAAGRIGGAVVALHVHHGLSLQADAWLDHCARCCESSMPSRVSFASARLALDRSPGESVEAWARRGRYAALAAMARAHGVDEVLLAHHRRDQAETFLLQALRGGGLAGLASMPAEVVREGVRWRRPWLGRGRAEIDRYRARHGLVAVEDDSNADPRFERNRLRLQAWPALAEAFPRAERALSVSARWAQEAAALAGEVAVDDLAVVAPDGPLRVERWLRLSPARRSNALRAWVRRERGVAAPSSLCVRLATELAACRSGRWPLGSGELRLFDSLLGWAPSGRAPPGAAAREGRLSIAAPGRYPLPGWGGALVVEPAPPGTPGLPLDLLAALDLRARAGGERFRLAAGRPARALKQQYQQAGIAPWHRDGPLVYAGDRLLFVPGLGIDGGVATPSAGAGAGEVRLAWVAEAPTLESRAVFSSAEPVSPVVPPTPISSLLPARPDA